MVSFSNPTPRIEVRRSDIIQIILETAVQEGKVMQNFELESLLTGGEHSQKVKAPPVESDYGSKDCVNFPSSTAVFRLKKLTMLPSKSLMDRNHKCLFVIFIFILSIGRE